MEGIVFKIDGDEFPFDDSDSLTIDEAIVLHDYSGLTLDQLEDIEGFNPKVIAAFMHISMTRKMPDLKATDIRKKVGAVKVEDLSDAFSEAEEKAADALPPVPPPSASDEPGKLGGKELSSGSDGTNGGDPVPVLSAPTSTGSRA